MKVISTKEMYQLDQQTCKNLNITSFELMTKAAKSMSLYLKEHLNFSHNVIVIAGSGNNGGDAILLHQYIREYTNSTLYIFGGANQSKDNKEALTCSYKDSVREFNSDLKKATHIIDGLFGIGFKGELGEISKITKAVNSSSTFVYSIDIPSGINGNNGLASKDAVLADETLVVEHYKYGNLLQDALDHSKKNTIIKIGIEDSTSDSTTILNPTIQKRKHNSHKYNYGSVLIIGGSTGMTGAPVLSSMAALRSGTGLVHLSILEKHFNALKDVPIEIMVHKHITTHDIQNLFYKKSAIVFGMGLGRNDDINDKICEELVKCNVPTIIDADGIYYLKNHLENVQSDIIITPHFGELSILLDIPLSKIQQDPMKYVKQLTKNKLITVILKGPTTVIAKEETLIFSSSGNPGMATAGSGDVLAGIISRFLVDDTLQAATNGVYIHSRAGKLAQKEFGEEGMIATDIIKYIPTIIKRLQNE